MLDSVGPLARVSPQLSVDNAVRIGLEPEEVSFYLLDVFQVLTHVCYTDYASCTIVSDEK